MQFHLKDKQKKVLKCARKHGVKVRVVDYDLGVWEFGLGGIKKYTNDFALYFNGKPGVVLCKDKHVTKKILARNNINCPKGEVISTSKDLRNVFNKKNLKFPLVAKPVDGAKGVGVHLNLKNKQEVKVALSEIVKVTRAKKQRYSGKVVVEEMVAGNDFRLLVLKNKIIACCQRLPANITGDGKTTVAKIIGKFNAKRDERFKLIVDEEVSDRLKVQGITLKTILPAGKNIVLRQVANISEGGISLNQTGRVSKRFCALAVKAVQSLGLVFAGVDLLTDNIQSNDLKQPYYILEVNGAPQYEINEAPLAQGKIKTDVTDILFRSFMGLDK